jgi:uncharacterized membrane protein
MASVEKTIDVRVPVSAAYNQWTQFEEFPRFMEGVKRVKQVADDRLHWEVSIGGKDEEWDARITEQDPDQRIAWTSTGGARNAGVVTFHKLEPEVTRVALQIEYEPEGALESIGDAIGVVGRRIEGDLERFKEFIEDRGRETGGWRGEIR